MRNASTFITTTLLSLALYTQAQQAPAKEAFASTAATPEKVLESKIAKANAYNFSPEQARTQLLNSLNALRLNSDEDVESIFKEGNFQQHLGAIQVLLEKDLQRLQTDEVKDALQMKEKSRLLAGLNILKSAACLNDKDAGEFIRQSDLEGSEIIAFSLDALRGNVRYGLVEAYKEGFARIKKDQVFGFLNYCGDEAIPNQYEQADFFNNGKALTKKVNWFFIDADGKESEPLKDVVTAKALAHGVSMVQLTDGKFAFINNKYAESKMLISATYDAIEPFYKDEIYKIRVGKKWGLMTLNGVVKLEPFYNQITPSNVANLYRIEAVDGMVGLLDTNWVVRFQPNFNSIGDFNKFGLAQAKIGTQVKFLDARTGRQSKLYGKISDFNDYGIAVTTAEYGACGLIDSTMKVIIEPMYAQIGAFNRFGLAAVSHGEGKNGYINREGVEILTPRFSKVGEFNSYGLVVTKEDNASTVYDKNGKIVVLKTPNTQFEITEVVHSNRYNALKVLDKSGSFVGFHLVDLTNKRQVTKTPFEAINPIDVNGYLEVSNKNLWGLIDTAGREIVACKYENIERQSEGFYGVRETDSKRMGFIDLKGKVQVPFDYETVKPFRLGYAVVSKGKDKWGVINKFNAKIVPCMFRSITIEIGKIEIIATNNQKFILDEKGNCLDNCKIFEEIRKKANQ